VTKLIGQLFGAYETHIWVVNTGWLIVNEFTMANCDYSHCALEIFLLMNRIKIGSFVKSSSNNIY